MKGTLPRQNSLSLQTIVHLFHMITRPHQNAKALFMNKKNINLAKKCKFCLRISKIFSIVDSIWKLNNIPENIKIKKAKKGVKNIKANRSLK